MNYFASAEYTQANEIGVYQQNVRPQLPPQKRIEQ